MTRGQWSSGNTKAGPAYCRFKAEYNWSMETRRYWEIFRAALRLGVRRLPNTRLTWATDNPVARATSEITKVMVRLPMVMDFGSKMEGTAGTFGPGRTGASSVDTSTGPLLGLEPAEPGLRPLALGLVRVERTLAVPFPPSVRFAVIMCPILIRTDYTIRDAKRSILHQ